MFSNSLRSVLSHPRTKKCVNGWNISASSEFLGVVPPERCDDESEEEEEEKDVEDEAGAAASQMIGGSSWLFVFGLGYEVIPSISIYKIS